MRVLQLYNNYKSGGGGETRVVEVIERLLTQRGHTVRTLVHDNSSIDSALHKVTVTFTGIYSFSARKNVAAVLAEWKPDIIHVHNLYPLFSPSVLKACRDASVPVVMSVHNYGLSCPTGAHFRDGQNCQRCLGGHEYQCILGNCKGSLFVSAGYALRSTVARTFRQFVDGVDLFLAVSDFVKIKMVEAGYNPAQIAVLENGAPIPAVLAGDSPGDYVAYIGGMNVEKGVETLLLAAQRLPHVEFVLAGHGPDQARWAASAPPNCRFVGRLDRQAVERLFRDARFTVIPSLWWEPFGLVAIEAMGFGRAVIAARSGALTDLVHDGIDGLLFPPGNIAALTTAIDTLWNDPVRACNMGALGRIRVEQQYSDEVFTDRLLEAYTVASSVHPRVSCPSRPR
jgi:glycosyltransferase involved in cell wall biosynthesis